MEDIYSYLNELQKIEVVFKDENNIPYCLKSYIKCLDEDRILIDPPNYRGKSFVIKLGQDLKIVIYSKKGLFIGESSVKGKEIGALSGIWLSYPYNSQHYQRREYLRVPLLLDSQLTIIKNDNKAEIFKVKTKDLSAKGCSITFDEPLENYKDIKMSIKLQDENSTEIRVNCDHIYSKKVPLKDKVQYTHAFLFTNITEREASKIVRECFKHQLRQRKKD